MSLLCRGLARLPLSGRLALVAVLLGGGALLIGTPGTGTTVRIDERELARLVESETDHVTPEELADWLIAGRQDFRLIDLRPEGDYAAYHVPGAERIPITALPDAGLPRNEKIVLYSEEGIHSAQAWFLLKARKYPAAYLLLGGIHQWQERVLFPVEPAAGAPEAERAEFARAAERARFFGGSPRAASAAAPGAPGVVAPPTAALPQVSPPAAPPATSAAARKKKEGC
jgi:rhodanese-related sulfurtransferase